MIRVVMGLRTPFEINGTLYMTCALYGDPRTLRYVSLASAHVYTFSDAEYLGDYEWLVTERSRKIRKIDVLDVVER